MIGGDYSKMQNYISKRNFECGVDDFYKAKMVYIKLDEKDARSLAWHMNRHSFTLFFVNNFVPTEHREITLVEFKTSVNDACGVIDKSGR